MREFIAFIVIMLMCAGFFSLYHMWCLDSVRPVVIELCHSQWNEWEMITIN
jgi:hypothetical protein